MNNDAEDARSLSRYLVAEYLNKNDGINFLNKKGSESGQPRSLRRLEAFLEIETKKGEFYLQIHPTLEYGACSLICQPLVRKKKSRKNHYWKE